MIAPGSTGLQTHDRREDDECQGSSLVSAMRSLLEIHLSPTLGGLRLRLLCKTYGKTDSSGEKDSVSRKMISCEIRGLSGSCWLCGEVMVPTDDDDEDRKGDGSAFSGMFSEVIWKMI